MIEKRLSDMACNPDFVQFIIDQCSGAGEIAVKKMMGDYCAYCDGAKGLGSTLRYDNEM